jgi:DNA-binding NarL/FixJ family response regulator
MRSKVLLVDDHASVREGLALTINSQADLIVCGEAEEANQALDAIAMHKPDVAVIDISLGGRSGLELIRDIRLRHSRLPLLVFSMHDEAVYGERAIRSGAQGYVHKKESVHKVVAAIRRILNGHTCLSEPLANRILQNAMQGQPVGVLACDKLTNRELEILQLIGEGHGSQQIARDLGMSERTVETHRLHIRRKLGVAGAAQLLQHAIQWVRSQK